MRSYFPWSPPCVAVTEAHRSALPHLPGPYFKEPDGIGTFRAARRGDGCRSFVGTCPSTPLDANGYLPMWIGRVANSCRRKRNSAPHGWLAGHAARVGSSG